MLIVFDWEMMGSDEIKIKEWIKEWKELGPWEKVRGWETIGFSQMNKGQKWKSRKMKSEKVRIFFPDGRKRLGCAWGWRRWLFYALAYWILTEFNGLSGHLEIILEQIVYFKEFLLGFNVSESKKQLQMKVLSHFCASESRK